ncbi:hypothetical protein [Streptomyces sp. NPDC048560]|uniref:hypothetical protein n=1 Tax=Streptomyces sp. NPDC048560 TaxID=3155488 RepID=UPI00343505F4
MSAAESEVDPDRTDGRGQDNAGPDEADGDSAYGDGQFDPDVMHRLRSDLDEDVDRFGGAASMNFARRVRAHSIVGGDQFVLNMGGARRPSWYRLSAAGRTELEQVYVRPGCADAAEELLRRQHLVVLSGARHTGRRFLASALAVTVLPDDGECRFLQPGTHPDTLTTEDVRRDCAYVLEAGAGSALTDFALTRLSGLMTRRHAYLVITVEDAARLPEDLREWTVCGDGRPDAAAVFRSHLRHRLPDRSGRADTLLRDPRIAAWLTESPPPGEIARIARELALTTDDESAVATCMAQVTGQAERVAGELLKATGSARELAISTAFFGGFPYATVRQLEHLLADLVHEAGSHDTPRSRQFLTETRQSRLDDIHAVTRKGIAHTRYGSSPTEVVDFAGSGLAAALVDVVWRYDDSEPLLRWLSDLVHDPSEAVRRRAAVSLGRLSLLDFTQIAEQVFQPWSLSSDHRDRVAAAIALSVSVQDPTVAAHALGLVESWSAAGNRYRRMTAALAWGLAVSPAHPVAGVQGLGDLLGTDDAGVAWSAKAGLTAAFAGGLSGLVLEAMGVWLRDAEGAARRNLLGAFLRVCRVRGTEGRPDAVHWPTPLWLFDRFQSGGRADASEQRDGPADTDQDVIELWQAALSHRATSAEALRTLGSWIRQADRHGESREALLDLLDELVDTPSDFRRMDHLLSRMARDSSQPSHTAELASRELDKLR